LQLIQLLVPLTRELAGDCQTEGEIIKIKGDEKIVCAKYSKFSLPLLPSLHFVSCHLPRQMEVFYKVAICQINASSCGKPVHLMTGRWGWITKALIILVLLNKLKKSPNIL